MPYFRVIIPTYNNEETLKRAIGSVQGQTFTDYDLIVVDDCSDSQKTINDILETCQPLAGKIFLDEKRCSGGARNEGSLYCDKDDYTLFLDADDNFLDAEVFEDLHDFIEECDRPDMVRLPYIRHDIDGKTLDMTTIMHRRERNIFGTTKSPRVACWTKCVRTDKLEKFPEDTLCEDVFQHLVQCDVTESWAMFWRPVIMWNRSSGSTSLSMSPKWQESCIEFPELLLACKALLTKPYTRARCDEKYREAVENLKKGRFLQ